MARWVYLGVGLVLGVFGTVATGRGSTQDPVRVSPHLYSVRLDNDRVRVLEYRLKPGGKETMHAHPPGIVYVLNAANVRSTLADGKIAEISSKPGEVSWREATSHSLENIGQTEAHNLAIEVKPCTQQETRVKRFR